MVSIKIRQVIVQVRNCNFLKGWLAGWLADQLNNRPTNKLSAWNEIILEN
jgi:glucose-6-phosphate dehydrogenase assembly protein OpcA